MPLSSTPVDSRTPSAAAVEPPPPPPSVATESTDVFIKSFVFSPEVPIRIDYEAKWFHSEQVVGTNSKERSKLSPSLPGYTDRYPPGARSSR